MKKNTIILPVLAIFLLGLFVVSAKAQTGSNCVDSDADASQPSEVAGFVTLTKKNKDFKFYDSCVDENTIDEYSCDNNTVKHKSVTCDSGFGCLVGACRVSPTKVNIGSTPASGNNNIVEFCSFNEDGVPVRVKQTCFGSWSINPCAPTESCSAGEDWILDPADIEEYGCELPLSGCGPEYVNVNTSYKDGAVSGNYNVVEFCVVVDGASFRFKAICTGDWKIVPSDGKSSAIATCSSEDNWIYRIAGGKDIEEVDECPGLTPPPSD